MSPLISGGGGVSLGSVGTVTGTAILGQAPIATSATAAAWAYPPGFQFDYAEVTTALTITATTEGGAQAYITGGAVTYDGSTRVKLEVYVPWVTVSTTSAAVPVLLDGATVLGWGTQIGGGQSTAGNTAPSYNAMYLTPSAASHTFSVAWFKTAGTASANAGAGATGTVIKAWLRVTKA